MEIIMVQTLQFAFSMIITTQVKARKPIIAFIFAPLLFLALAIPAEAVVRYDASHQEWTLQTGSVEYKLAQEDGAVFLKYFGPVGQPTWDLPPAKTKDRKSTRLNSSQLGISYAV